MQSFAQDVRLALRRHQRTPGFTTTVVLTLALGIGCATAVLTVAEALLLRRLPIANQESVVVLSGQSDQGAYAPLGLESTVTFGEATKTLAGVAILNFEGAAPVTMLEGDRITRLKRSLVSGNYFSVLGVQPQLGRTLRPEDDVSGASPVVVLSHRAWTTRFGSSPDIIGRRITTREDGITSTVVGVMPIGLDYPRGVDAWTPVRMIIPPANMGMLAFDAIGRLKSGSTVNQAKSELTNHLQRDGANAAERRLRGRAVAITELILGNTKPAIVAFIAASALLLLITCLNVANLLLVRGLARGRDTAVRLALGASRGRIMREVVTEQSLLAFAGGIVGAAVAVIAVRMFVAVAPAGLPRLDEIQVNGTVLASALALAVLATLLSAVTPALWAARADARIVTGSASAIVSGDTRHTGGRAAQLMRELLVGGQVALALLVLSAAGLLGRSLWKLERAELAFDPSRLTIAELAIAPGQYDRPELQADMYARLQQGLKAIPGIQDVSPVVTVPFAEVSGWKGRPSVEGQSESEIAGNPMVDFEVVSPSFFETLGLPVQSGRAFTESDRAGAPPVAVLSASAAQRYWPNADPIGRKLRIGTRAGAPEFMIVGVVPDPRYRDLREAHPTMYFPVRQSLFPFAPPTLVVRTTLAPNDVSDAIRRVLSEVAPNVALARTEKFESLLAGPLAQPRMNAMLLAGFAAAAMILSAIGLFGVLATTVRQRTREFGIRMALGATASNVVGLVMRRGLFVAGTGAAVGLIGAIAANQLLASLLYEVSPLDLWTLTSVVALVVAVFVVSAVLPARAVTQIHPARALRAE